MPATGIWRLLYCLIAFPIGKRDAYVTKENGERWTVIQNEFRECRSKTRSTVGVEKLQELLSVCIALRKDKELMGRGIACINAETIEAVTGGQGDYLYYSSTGRPMGFNAKYLETALRFILCANKEVEVYYSRDICPLYFLTGNLYVMILPMHMK